MGAFGGLILTNQGRALQAKAQAGAQLVYTKIKIGDGNLGGQSIPTLTNLISPKKTIDIRKIEVRPGGVAVIGTMLSNSDVTEGFYFREIGVFAQDPDIGEILYCYGNAGANAEYIPPGGGPDVIEKYIDIRTLTGNAPNVSAVIDDSLVYALKRDLEELDVRIQDAKTTADTALATAQSATQTAQQANQKADQNTSDLVAHLNDDAKAHKIENITGLKEELEQRGVNVKSLGAVGDGVVDDTAVIQSALDNFGTVILPPGVYKVSGIRLKTGNRLIGMDEQNTVLVPSTNDVTLVTLSNARECSIENLKIDGYGMTGCVGLYVANQSTNVSVKNVWFDSLNTAVRTNDSYFLLYDTCRIMGCALGFDLQSASNSVTLLNCSMICTVKALQWINSSGLSLIGNTFENKTEIDMFNCFGANLSGNYFEDDGNTNAYHLKLGTGSGLSASGISIKGNQFNHGATHGIIFMACQGVTIDGNNFRTNSFAFGWYQYDNSPKRAVSIGNNSYDIGGLGFDASKIVEFQGSDFDSLNCNFNDNQVQPLLFFKQKEPQSVTIGNEQCVLYWDGTSLKIKAKGASGEIKTATIATP